MTKNENSDVKVTLVMGEQTFSGEGSNTNAALDSLGLDYTMVKEKGTVILEKDGKRAEKFFYLRPLRRIVASKLRKAQVARDLEHLLK